MALPGQARAEPAEFENVRNMLCEMTAVVDTPVARDAMLSDAGDYERLRGSLIRVKDCRDGAVFPGGGQYAVIRAFQGVRKVGERVFVKVSYKNEARDVQSREIDWLDRYCGGIVMGLLADTKESASVGRGPEADAAQIDGKLVTVVAVARPSASPAVNTIRYWNVDGSAADAAESQDLAVEDAVQAMGKQWMDWAEAEAPQGSEIIAPRLAPNASQHELSGLDYGSAIWFLQQLVDSGKDAATVRSQTYASVGLTDGHTGVIYLAAAVAWLSSFVGMRE